MLTCDGAAKYGHLEILQWAVANGCEMGEMTSSLAGAGGHLRVLKWLKANGCSMDTSAALFAAENGHLEVLKWILANGGIGSSYLFDQTAMAGQHEVLDWLKSNGYPYDGHVCQLVKDQPEIIKWLTDNKIYRHSRFEGFDILYV